MNWPPAPLVLDANLCLYVLAPLPQHDQAVELLATLMQYERPWYAPALWRVEVISGLRKMEAAGMWDNDMVQEATVRFWEWPVQIVAEERSLLEAALRWSRRVGQRVIYDSVYLALADHLDAEFWTADRRLYQHAQQAGATFVHLFS